MTLEAAFHNFDVQCRTLYDALVGLRLTVIEDKPLVGEVVLVDALGDTADELLGWLEEALKAAAAGQEAMASRVEVNRAIRALTTCQERCNHLRYRFLSNLGSYERIAELMSVGHERQGEWLAWAQSVKDGLDRCQQPLYDVDHALFLCWQEIGALVGIVSLSAPVPDRAIHKSPAGEEETAGQCQHKGLA